MNTIVRGFAGRPSPLLVRPGRRDFYVPPPQYAFFDDFNRADGAPNDPPDHPWTFHGDDTGDFAIALQRMWLYKDAARANIVGRMWTTYADIWNVTPISVSMMIGHNSDMIDTAARDNWRVCVGHDAERVDAGVWTDQFNNRWIFGLGGVGAPLWSAYIAGYPPSGATVKIARDGDTFTATFAGLTLQKTLGGIFGGDPAYASVEMNGVTTGDAGKGYPTGIFADDFLVVEA